MSIRGLGKYEFSRIEGQPTEEDLNQLIKELTNALGSLVLAWLQIGIRG
jgi:hypothetical protein